MSAINRFNQWLDGIFNTSSATQKTAFFGVYPTNWSTGGAGYAWECECLAHGGRPEWTEAQTQKSYNIHLARWCENRRVN